MRAEMKGVLVLWLALASGCRTDLECSLNGQCRNGACVCDPPWAGRDCGELVTLAPKVVAAYAGGSPFVVSSWGGNVIWDNSTQLYHLFVNEIAGAGCGLHVWSTQSVVVHATSKCAQGPYQKQSVLLPHQASNPHAIRYEGSWYIFHIGSANATNVVKSCNETSSGPFGPAQTENHPTLQMLGPEPRTGGSTDVRPRTAGGSTDVRPRTAGGSVIHSSSSPYGPFAPVLTSLMCNNPSPFVHPNGTLFVACCGHLFLELQRSENGPAGPWTTVATAITYGQGYEDPCLFIDRRGNFHILAHAWSADPFPTNPISGHTFSVDGLHWQPGSATQPYNNNVLRADGTVQPFATLERPKLLFSDPIDPFRPTFIFNGAAPYWGTGADPCAVCVPGNQPGHGAHCSYCKQASVAKGDKENTDWTYTLVRPLGS